MDFLSIALGLLFAVTLIRSLLTLTSANRSKNLPPGPAQLPIIGNLHQMGNKPHQSLARLAKIYGPIMSLKLGRVTTVVITSAAAAKEVLQKQDLAFSGRSVPDAVNAHGQAQFSVVWLPVGSRWRSLRKILNSNIFSGNRLDANQHLRSKKVDELIAYCRRSCQAGEAVDIGRAGFRTSLNLLSNTLFSTDLTDPYQDSAKEFKEVVEDISGVAGKPNLVDYFPVFKKIDPQRIRQHMAVNFGKVLERFDGLFNERLEFRKLRKPVGSNDDVLDVLLNVAEEDPDEIDRTHIERMCLDLFIAGTDTTSSTLEWAMTELLRNPGSMAKAKKELEQVIGKGKTIEEGDLPRLPYLQCVMKETLRMHPAVPFLIPRRVEVDVEMWGYNIPKGAQVLVNAWAIGRDPSLWEDSLAFKPERFLASELDVRGRDFELIPFGAGRRMCPGLPLAMRMVPVMLGSLINSFDWQLDGGIAPMDLGMEEKFGITLQKAIPLCAVPKPLVSHTGKEKMDYISSIALGLLLALTLIQAILSHTRRKSTNLPPGPAPLPIIGSLHKLGDQPHQSLAKLAKDYGPVMSLKLGRVTTVVISSSAAAKEVLQKQDIAFSSRSIPDAVNAHSQSRFSVVWLPVGSRWRSLRKILNSNIFSGSRLDANQHLRSKKVEELLSYCRKSCQAGEAVDVGRAAFRTSLNLLSNTMFSKDLADPYQDSAKEFKELVGSIMAEAGRPNLVDYFPVLKKIDPQGIRRRMTVHFGKVIELFHGLINERLELRRLNKPVGSNDVLDVLLNIAEEIPDEIDITHIERLCLDLFVAGSDTTSSTLEWAMAELLLNPVTMAKAKAELEQVIGKGKIIEEADVSRLPYLQCIVKEALRMHPAVPFLIPRRVEVDVEACGYTVPKGAQVLVNVWAIGRDPTLWEDPLSFNPERFLASDLDIRGRDFELIPFGAGRRICPGLPLAIRMVPVMLGSLINSFNWELDGGVASKELAMEEKFGITLQKAQPLRAVPMALVL
ncbi:hypothetical protein RJ640_030397 [Escallonia rubra]|uniref:Geraniol 10-hydroxylase n=1 Tax=Escallonia rubra TaxID=112253 RepID=A0AA88QT35_9ASTE|nr:hypothetical protein RJ640_030397 [Escallonia rubra]